MTIKMFHSFKSKVDVSLSHSLSLIHNNLFMTISLNDNAEVHNHDRVHKFEYERYLCLLSSFFYLFFDIKYKKIDNTCSHANLFKISFYWFILG